MTATPFTPPTSPPSIPTRTLGRTGPRVSSVGLGCMGLAGAYGPTDDAESVRLIHAYLDAGGSLLDTADFYAAGRSEQQIARVLRERNRDEIVLSVKFGARPTLGGLPSGFDARPAAVRSALAYSLQRLGTDYVDIYRPARLDPTVPIEETVGAIAELVDHGYVRHIGLSEVGAATVRRAAAVAPISDLQIEYSLLTRGIEDDILPTCRELGIAVTAYGVLAKGLIGGSPTAADVRAAFPRFQGENRAHNEALVAPLSRLADERGVSAAQLAIAWVAAQGHDIVPVVGARRQAQVDTLIDSAHVELDEAALTELERLIPRDAARGERYPTAQLAQLDSERR